MKKIVKFYKTNICEYCNGTGVMTNGRTCLVCNGEGLQEE